MSVVFLKIDEGFSMFQLTSTIPLSERKYKKQNLQFTLPYMYISILQKFA